MRRVVAQLVHAEAVELLDEGERTAQRLAIGLARLLLDALDPRQRAVLEPIEGVAARARALLLRLQVLPEGLAHVPDGLEALVQSRVAAPLQASDREVGRDQQVLALAREQGPAELLDHAPIDGRLLDGLELADLRRELLELGLVANAGAGRGVARDRGFSE